MRSDHIRERALHDASRLRDALALIAEMAERSHSALTLPDIAPLREPRLSGQNPKTRA